MPSTSSSTHCHADASSSLVPLLSIATPYRDADSTYKNHDATEPLSVTTGTLPTMLLATPLSASLRAPS